MELAVLMKYKLLLIGLKLKNNMLKTLIIKFLSLKIKVIYFKNYKLKKQFYWKVI